jgi:choline monooxygenase
LRSIWRTTTSVPFHPGLGSFVTCDDLRWEFKDRLFRANCRGGQPAGQGGHASGGSPVYERWQNATAELPQWCTAPKFGAIWLTYYPHIMVEWYPHVLTVSTLHPIGPQKTMNMVEFYYPEEIVAFEREFVEAQQAAYMETCIEDDEIGDCAWTPAARADAAWRQRSRPLPEPDGRRHAALSTSGIAPVMQPLSI